MFNEFFCAEASRLAKEDLIGYAGTYPIYLLVECPPPWTANAFASKSVPANFQALIKEEQGNKPLIRPLLIYSEILKQKDCTRVIIFHNQPGFSGGYQKEEFHLQDINEVAPFVRAYMTGNYSGYQSIETATRDILICTHGSHDQCCAKYGNPFYRQALATISELSLSQIRVWQTSHFGGHRFAPTAIDFPSGRWYGRLERESLISVLTQTGDIQCLNWIYRGWGILPPPAQILERELIFLHGWDWFDYQVAYQILSQHDDNNSFNRIELNFKTPDGTTGSYTADVIKDETKTVYLQGDCNSNKVAEIPKFSVKNLVRCN